MAEKKEKKQEEVKEVAVEQDSGEVKEGVEVENTQKESKKSAWFSLRHFRVFGFALIFLGIIICVLLAIIFFTKYFEFTQKETETETETQPTAVITVTDDEILSAIPELARSSGVFGEPAGVTGFAGFRKMALAGETGPDETIAVVVTGNGLKDIESAKRSAGKPLSCAPEIEEFSKLIALR